MNIPGILISVLSATVSACNPQTPSPPYQPPKPSTMQEINQFAGTIEQIGSRVKRLDLADELFAETSFRDIYENPQAYLASASAIIARHGVSAHHKKIIGYAMQQLPPEQFVMFVTAMTESVEQGTTDMETLETTVFTPLNWGRQSLIGHYQQPIVQALLARLLAMPQLSSVNRHYIRDDILTGKARQDFLDYRDMIGRPVYE